MSQTPTHELIYGYLGTGGYQDLEASGPLLEQLQQQHVDGLFLIEPNIEERHIVFGQWCRDNGIDLVLAFTDDPNDPNEARLVKAMSVTHKIAIGNTPAGEWRDRAVTQSTRISDYRRMADQYGFEWCCTLTQNSLLRGFARGSQLRQELGKTLCFCLCAYVISGHLYREPRMPHGYVIQTGQRTLHDDYGVTRDKLRHYLEPMNVLSGAGWQPGLDVGSRVYARELGFKGMVIGTPFNLEGTDRVPMHDEPKNHRKVKLAGFSR